MNPKSFTASSVHWVHHFNEFVKGLWSFTKALTQGPLIPNQALYHKLKPLIPKSFDDEDWNEGKPWRGDNLIEAGNT